MLFVSVLFLSIVGPLCVSIFNSISIQFYLNSHEYGVLEKILIITVCYKHQYKEYSTIRKRKKKPKSFTIRNYLGKKEYLKTMLTVCNLGHPNGSKS